MGQFGIHWFRRDLRIHGNEALKYNWKRNKGRVVGVFCFDKKFLSRPDFSNNRFQFFLKTLESLQDEMRKLGSDLVFLDEGPAQSFPSLIEEINKQYGQKPSLVTWGRDYEPFSRVRDSNIQELFKSLSVGVKTFRDHLLIEPEELSKLTDSSSWYKVYSPYAKRWLDIFEEETIQSRIKRQKNSLKYLNRLDSLGEDKIFKLNSEKLLPSHNPYRDNLEIYLRENEKHVTIEVPQAGSKAVLKLLKGFSTKIDTYKRDRDVPIKEGTSKFSMYLKNGSLTVPQIIAYYDLKKFKEKKSGRDTFFSELIWREFFYHILFHTPEVEKSSFQEKYRDLQWENNEDWFEKWKLGMTGYPIVDAGMRELRTTGWMHNRVRMIVASFLTKDLLIDWRWGEKYFMETLLDGDLAPNNGGWQWAASTGCDAQPYFRIFNPWSQSEKFDPEAKYIKSFVPELKDLSAKEIHKPIVGHQSYPEPIVDHKEQRQKALAMFKQAIS